MSEKYNQFSSSSLGTEPWACINTVTMESWFVAQINIPLNFPVKWHASKHAKFAYGATSFCACNTIKLRMKRLDGKSSLETATSFGSLQCAYPPFRFIRSQYNCIKLYPLSSFNINFEVAAANARPIVESFKLHPNSVISILCSWICDVIPFFTCSKYLARKLQSKAGGLYLEITWSFMDQVCHHTPDEICSPVFELLTLRWKWQGGCAHLTW